MKDLVSIIVPVYNSEKYLNDCLKSIKKQTYKEFECILIDDGSNDLSGIICDEFCVEDDRFKVYHNENNGVSYARNFGITKSKGKYISFVDSDDIIDERFLEKMIDKLNEEKADICFCKYNKFDEKNILPVHERYLNSYTYKDDEHFFDHFIGRFFIGNVKDNSILQMGSSCRILFIKEKIKYMFNEKVYMCEDLVFVLYNLLNIKKVAVVNEYLYNYRINDNSISHTYKQKFLENQKSFLDSIYNFLIKLNMPMKKINKIFEVECAVRTYYLFSNEIKYRRVNKIFKHCIKKYKNDETYKYFKLKNLIKIKYKHIKLKYFIVYLIVKFGIYKIL